IFLISAGYSQIIELFPAGGGGYLGASKLLNPTMGMICGCALLIDYILTLTISIAAGADAIFSFLPAALHVYMRVAIFLDIILLSASALRRAKQSILVLMPVFTLSLVPHAFIILYAIPPHAEDIPALIQATSTATRSSVSQRR